ncbi:hypothetical protein S40285_03502 [Stachybotrys chlorohalonatus IBT 40285]|uniref:Major facilitator superfamily (MFS) profile domain-containing protein n=1 Tax=Stachybotrys chlorohalonatus (strain IBT 40285) TaxID=1283841 RepID=A0A084QCK1_STAC4|nr:hypothetical protein S40285_03502 [Stachybotrys chlorohalonata IBT 40285]
MEKEVGASTPPGGGSSVHSADPTCPPHTTERKLLFRIDMRVVPWLSIMYVMAFLDRVNIANANVLGLSEELGLVGNQYNVALVIFFVPYCLFEIPSNVLLKRFKPHIWLSGNMLAFGFVTMMMGLVQNYSGLLACRFFLGVFETGMFPGAFYLIGMWYRRDEAQKRYSFFFNSTTLAGAFGGLLAAAIGQMDGLRGYMGWRWIFIVEGGLTVFISFFFFFLLPDFPEEVKWLNEEEKTYVTARLRADQGKAVQNRNITVRDVMNIFKDYKVIVGGFMYFGLIVPAYSYAYFAPGIIRGYGYNPIDTQLFSVPPWAVAFVFSMCIATISDKVQHRFGFAVFCICVSIAGLATLVNVHDNTTLQYVMLFLVTSGTYTAMPIIVCWFNMNLGGHHRRSVGSAWQVGFGNTGGIIATFAFQQRDAPQYLPGYSICLSFAALAMVSCVVYLFACHRANVNKDKDRGSDTALTEDEKAELGDLSPDYRYLL